jgi:2-dehydro-3-deoxyphosphooctonate aldolase (KDO 8-P synthase)
MNKPIQIGSLTVKASRFLLIAGPCVIESEEQTLGLARQLSAMARSWDVDFVFKASFDKANRSSLNSFRGPGLPAGLKILKRVKEELGVPVLSDVHSPEQAEACAEVLDMLQIPAFLSRQTDLLLAAARTGKAVNIKKAQFTAPLDMEKVIAKVASVNQNILVTERGFAFGYNNLVVDMRSLAILRGFGFPVIFDATHSVQLPGGGVQSGGERGFVPVLARAAAGAGIDGMFLETHENPDQALSDGATQLRLKDLPEMMKPVLAIHRLVQESL